MSKLQTHGITLHECWRWRNTLSHLVGRTTNRLVFLCSVRELSTTLRAQRSLSLERKFAREHRYQRPRLDSCHCAHRGTITRRSRKQGMTRDPLQSRFRVRDVLTHDRLEARSRRHMDTHVNDTDRCGLQLDAWHIHEHSCKCAAWCKCIIASMLTAL